MAGSVTSPGRLRVPDHVDPETPRVGDQYCSMYSVRQHATNLHAFMQSVNMQLINKTISFPLVTELGFPALQATRVELGFNRVTSICISDRVVVLGSTDRSCQIAIH